jgi:hypothetical protein
MDPSDLEKMMVRLLAGMEARMMAKMDAWRGVTPACLEEEPAPEEPKAVVETEEVPEGATDEEAIGVTED